MSKLAKLFLFVSLAITLNIGCSSVPEKSCLENIDCQEGEECVEGKCTGGACKVDADCGKDQTCTDGKCVAKKTTPPACKDNDDCKAPTPYCVSGKCVACAEDSDCGDGEECKANTCVKKGDPEPECSPTKSCPAGKQCKDGKCVDAPKTCPEVPCPSGKVCKDKVCVDAPKTCPDVPCPSGKVCKDKVCIDAPSGCSKNSDCKGKNEHCIEGKCIVLEGKRCYVVKAGTKLYFVGDQFKDKGLNVIHCRSWDNSTNDQFTASYNSDGALVGDFSMAVRGEMPFCKAAKKVNGEVDYVNMPQMWMCRPVDLSFMKVKDTTTFACADTNMCKIQAK